MENQAGVVQEEPAENAVRSEHHSNLRQRSAETVRTRASAWSHQPCCRVPDTRADCSSDGHRFQTFQIKMDLEHTISGENRYFRAHAYQLFSPPWKVGAHWFSVWGGRIQGHNVKVI